MSGKSSQHFPFADASVPEGHETYKDDPARLENIPPFDVSPDVERLHFGDQIYLDEINASAPIGIFLEPLWWSLGTAIEYIQTALACKGQFDGFYKLESAIRAGTVKAFGSIDTAPVKEISVETWTEFQMIPFYLAQQPLEVVVRSVKSYRPAALRDHSMPSGMLVDSAGCRNGEPGYHRVVSNVFVKEAHLRRTFIAGRNSAKGRPISPMQKRLGETLSSITVKGRKVLPERNGVSFAEIARRVLRNWSDQDTAADRERDYSKDAVEQAVRRFYAVLPRSDK